MYSKNESPILRTSIFYYDDIYDSITSKKVLQTLLEHGFFPPQKIYAGHLTNNKFLPYNEDVSELFVKAYSTHDVLEIDMSSGNSRKVTDFWRIKWGLTFLKNSVSPPHSPKFKPWNVFTIDSTYGRLNDLSNYNNYFTCVQEIISILNPFYASIDDVNNKVLLMDEAHEDHFVADRIQQVFWGNYWGEIFCQKYNVDLFQIISTHNIKKINNGFFFTLTDSAFDFDSKECRRLRKLISKHIH